MNAHPAPDRISDHGYGLLTETEAGEIRDHLASCPDCAAFAGRVEAERARLREALAAAPPSGLEERVLAGLAAGPAAPPARGPFLRASWWPVAAAASFFFAIVALLLRREPARVPPVPEPVPVAIEVKPREPGPEDLKYSRLAGESRIPMAEALRKAIQEAGGGMAIDATLEEEDGRLVFAVDIAVGNKTVEIDLDAKTGQVVEKKTDDDSQAKLVRAFKVPLAQSIEAILRKMPGTAVEAELELERGRPEVHVTIVSGGLVRWVEADSESGEILRVKEPGPKNKEGSKEGR